MVRHVQTVCLGCGMSYFILAVLKFYLSIIIIVNRDFTSNKLPPKRTIKSFYNFSSKQSCQKTENEAAAYEGKVEGGEG